MKPAFITLITVLLFAFYFGDDIDRAFIVAGLLFAPAMAGGFTSRNEGEAS